ncbi:hypothetical protein C8R31_101656 [Nitrosospira sp. Nsp2]|uniref:hypothetical protein n=1 Tax=Nitrosospira sp. Nsp2 TaxID=136548 RepID=UPI000D319C40|nr:hypothetical protein [Nitrosospira sp. Nsp2]PTR17492.1 hypothetical protein C8R31_101656 [Nitrosospira sp. Nsp2]
MALTKTAVTVVSSQTRTAGGAAVRGRADLADAYGAFLTIKITNGATGPAAQCVCKIMVAHNAALPAAAAEGADWKVIAQYGGGLTANAITEVGIPIDIAVMHLQVDFDDNTSQNVTVEAFLSEVTTV